uniref:Peptidyl-tRNA hydrolase n=1 Tax=Rhizophora mucronata TaxID=61149 RepID=A0A2P2IYA6_RHIMU
MAPTDSPLAFMNVCGFANITGTSPIKPFPNRALKETPLMGIPSASAIASSISNPTL